MTSILSIESVEARNGFIYLPERSLVSPKLIFSGVVLIVLAMLFVGMGFLIPVVLFLAGYIFQTRTESKIEESKKLLPLRTPGASVVSRTHDCLLVDFFGKPKVVIGVDSFTPEKFSNDDWLTALAITLNREIQGVFTTGGPCTHSDSNRQWHRMLLADVYEKESASSVKEALNKCLNAIGITECHVDENLFVPTAGHEWWHTQGHSLQLRMDVPLPQVLALERRALHMVFRAPTKDSDCTIIATVRPAVGIPNAIEVGLDVTLFGQSQTELRECERNFLKAPYVKGPPSFRPQAVFSNIKIIHRKKLNFGAAFVAPPLEPTDRYACISSAQRPTYRMFQKFHFPGLSQ